MVRSFLSFVVAIAFLLSSGVCLAQTGDEKIDGDGEDYTIAVSGGSEDFSVTVDKEKGELVEDNRSNSWRDRRDRQEQIHEEQKKSRAERKREQRELHKKTKEERRSN